MNGHFMLNFHYHEQHFALLSASVAARRTSYMMTVDWLFSSSAWCRSTISGDVIDIVRECYARFLYHSVAVLPLLLRRSAVVKFRCSVKIM